MQNKFLKLISNNGRFLIFMIFFVIIIFFLFFQYDNKLNHLSFNQVVESNDEYVGRIVSWHGQISNHTHIDGIKFWIFDDEHKEVGDKKKYNEWFWAVFNEKDYLDIDNLIQNGDWDGSWLKYMMTAYGSDIKLNNLLVGLEYFLITGKIIELDCGYYDDACIPLIEVTKIEILKQ